MVVSFRTLNGLGKCIEEQKSMLSKSRTSNKNRKIKNGQIMKVRMSNWPADEKKVFI